MYNWISTTEFLQQQVKLLTVTEGIIHKGIKYIYTNIIYIWYISYIKYYIYNRAIYIKELKMLKLHKSYISEVWQVNKIS